MPWMAPVTLAKAGAITTLNRIGVRRGTTISRGVRADRAKRRRVRVANGPARERGARWRSGMVAGGTVVMAVIGLLVEKSGGETVARQPQVHVVERRPAGAHAFGRDAQVGDGGHGVAGRPPVQRDGQRGPDAERVFTGDAGRAQGGEGHSRITVDAQLDELSTEPSEERVGRIEADDATFVDDGNPVTKTLGLVEVVRREEDRHLAPFPDPADQVEKLEPDAWVQADCGLVEEQHLRVRDEGAGDLESTALAAAVALDRAVRLGGQAEDVEQVVDTGWRHVLGHTPQPSVYLTVAPAREAAIDGRLLEHNGTDAAGSQGLTDDIEAGQTGGARGRPDRRRQHADRRGLAGAVGTEQPEHLTPLDREVDALHRLDATGIGLAQAAYFDDRFRVCVSSHSPQGRQSN